VKKEEKLYKINCWRKRLRRKDYKKNKKENKL
jgi:hypothetical protein